MINWYILISCILFRCLNCNKDFVYGNELTPLSSYNAGTTTLKDFQTTSKHFEELETLKACNFTDTDVKLYYDSLQGDGHLFKVHKNYESSLLKERVNRLHETLKNYKEKKLAKYVLILNPYF